MAYQKHVPQIEHTRFITVHTRCVCGSERCAGEFFARVDAANVNDYEDAVHRASADADEQCGKMIAFLAEEDRVALAAEEAARVAAAAEAAAEAERQKIAGEKEQ